jgi:hypothetical protein
VEMEPVESVCNVKGAGLIVVKSGAPFMSLPIMWVDERALKYSGL